MFIKIGRAAIADASWLLLWVSLVLYPPLSRAESDTVSDKSVLTVHLVPVQPARWPLTLQAGGNLIPWQEVIIGAETGGLRITALHADVGDQVRRGQLLAELASDTLKADLRRYQAMLKSARASYHHASANARRARQIQGGGAISEQEAAEYTANEQTAQAAVEQAEAQVTAQRILLGQTRIVAIDDGVILTRSALLGQIVTVGSELYRLQRQGRLEWQAEVDARHLNLLHPGMNAHIALPSGKTVQGVVRLISPSLASHASRANVLVTLPDDGVVGLFVQGSIEVGEQAVIAVPESALVLRDGNSYLFTVGADQRVIRHRVTTGAHRQGLVAILSGIPAISSVVATGGAFLADGDRVQIAKEVK